MHPAYRRICDLHALCFIYLQVCLLSYLMSSSTLLADLPGMPMMCLEQRTYEWDMRAKVKCGNRELYHCLQHISNPNIFYEFCGNFTYISPGKLTSCYNIFRSFQSFSISYDFSKLRSKLVSSQTITNLHNLLFCLTHQTQTNWSMIKFQSKK